MTSHVSTVKALTNSKACQSFCKRKKTLKEVEIMLPFVVGDIVQIMEIGVDEESLLVGEGRVMTLSGGHCTE